MNEVAGDDTSKSQIETTPKIKLLIKRWGFTNLKTPEDLVLLRKKMISEISIRPYNDSTKEEEKAIRWKRTGSQILEDKYVYQGKSCTDIVIAFITLCKALRTNTRFVKLKDNKLKMVHSVAEIMVGGEWYIFDVSRNNPVPVKGEITENVPYGQYLLWKKGKDAWDLGLTEYNTINNVQV